MQSVCAKRLSVAKYWEITLVTSSRSGHLHIQCWVGLRSMLSTACCFTVDGQLNSVQRGPSSWQQVHASLWLFFCCRRLTFVFFAGVHSWPTHSSYLVSLKSECVWSLVTFVSHHSFLSSLHVRRGSWQYILYPNWAELSFLLNMKFLARFLLLICSSSSVLFLLIQFSRFFTAVPRFFLDTFYLIDLKAFHFLLRYRLEFLLACHLARPAGYPWLLILIVLVVSFLGGILSFLILCLTQSLVVNYIIA